MRSSKIVIIIGLVGWWASCAIGVLGAEHPAVYRPPVLRGVNFDPQHPYDLEFLVDRGDEKSVSKKEVAQLVRYFLAGLTIPREKLWVNLSPYEPQWIIDNDVAQTELGDVFLEQDYQLKQFAAALTNPETEIGKAYWRDTQGAARIETTQSLQKIWIMPDKANIQENGNGAFIREATLKVSMEDRVGAILAIAQNNRAGARPVPTDTFKQHILPLVENEVNSGKRFARLRQVYNSLVLSFWFKQKTSGYLYGQYFDQTKINGIDLADPKCKENTYARYQYSFKNGAYNLIRTDYDALCHKRIRRRYFSGGITIPQEWQPQLGPGTITWHANTRVHLRVLGKNAIAKKELPSPLKENLASTLTRLKSLLRNGEVYLQRLRYDIFDGGDRNAFDAAITGQGQNKLLYLQIDSVGCDSLCVWCMEGSRGEYAKGIKKNLSKEELIKFFDEIYSQGYRPLIRWGAWVGEPLMGKANREAKFAAIEHVARLGFKQILITNGHYLSSSTWEPVAKYISKVNISLDAGNERVNQQLKPGEAEGVWEEKMRNIQGLIDTAGKIGSKLKVSVSYLLHPMNIDQLDPDKEGGAFFARLKAMGVREFIVKAAHNEENARLSLGQTERAYRFISQAQPRFNDDKFRIIVLQDEAQASDKMGADEIPDFPKCYTATWQAALALDAVTGTHGLFACCQYPVGAIGNIGHIAGQGFASLWGSDEHKAVLQHDPRLFCRQCSPTDLYLNRLMNLLAEIHSENPGLYDKIVAAIFGGKDQEAGEIIDRHLGGIDFRLIGPAVGSKITGFSHFKQDFTGFEVDAISIDNV
jgi:MoaA/NifB/PqqE/SkfB family radical SAM enzyme